MRLQDFCRKLFDEASKYNFEGVEVSGSTGSSFGVNILSGEIETYKNSNSIWVNLRIKHNGKIGKTGTSALDEDYIPQMIENAKIIAEVIENDDLVYFSEKSEIPYAEPKMYNPDLDKITISEKIKLAKDMEAKALARDERVKRVQASSVKSGNGEYIYMNSNGVSVEKKSNSIYGYVAPVVEIAGKMNNQYDGFFTYDRDRIDVDKIVEKSVTEAIDLCCAESIPSGEYKLIIRYDAMGDMLATFSDIFSADSAQKGFSLLANKEGEMIASECLSIKDAPHMDWGIASTGIDGEGSPTKEKFIVENGKFNTLLYDIRTAEKVGKKTTGNSGGGGSITAFNMHICPGEKSFDELISIAENGVIITEFDGLHSGADSLTGDFSLPARGYLVENGKKTRAVSDITISGNFYKLIKNIEFVGNDLNFEMSDIASPSVLLHEKIVLAGK